MAAGGSPDMRYVLDYCKVSITGVCESDDPASSDRFITFTPMPGSTDKTVELVFDLYCAAMNGVSITTHLFLPVEKYRTAWREDRDRDVLQEPLRAFAKRWGALVSWPPINEALIPDDMTDETAIRIDFDGLTEAANKMASDYLRSVVLECVDGDEVP